MAAMQDAVEAAHASSADVNTVYSTQQLIALEQQAYSNVKTGEHSAVEAAEQDFGRLQQESAAAESIFSIVADVDSLGHGDARVVVDAPRVLGEL